MNIFREMIGQDSINKRLENEIEDDCKFNWRSDLMKKDLNCLGIL